MSASLVIGVSPLKTKIDIIIHRELVPLQQTFRSWEQLANGSFRFDPKTFRKAALKVQEVIDIARQLTEDIK